MTDTSAPSPMIETRAGVQMPRMIYGTAWKKERTEALVTEAIEAGFRGVDTACQPKHYHEAGVGAALSRAWSGPLSRDDFFVQTKFTSLDGQDPQRVPYDPKAPLARQVEQSFAASRKNLQTDHVDSLVLHGPLRSFADTLQVWRAMEQIHQSGGARQLGISNCYDLPYLKELWKVAAIKPAVVQNRFYAATGHDRELRRWCIERDVNYQSFWTLTANPEVLGSQTVRELATEHGKTPAQILFRYLVERGCAPLTGTASREHMRQDLEVLRFRLTDAQLEAMDRLF